MADKKDNAISYVRLLAMTMIILCHFFQFYENELAFWFNVGVQIFLVISGFLYGAKEIKEPIDFVCKQFKKILIPYYIFLIVALIFYAAFAKEHLSVESVIKAVFCIGTLDGLGHLWFIGYILVCYLITPYLYWLRKKAESLSLVWMSAVYIGLCLAIAALGTLLDGYFLPQHICCYLVGFIIASYCNKYGKSVLRFFAIGFGALAILLNAARIYIKYFYQLSATTVFGKIFYFCEPYMHLVLGVALFLGLYFAFSKTGACSLMRLSDKYSFQVYIVHQAFILSPFSTMSLFKIAPVDIAVTVVLIFVCGVALYWASNFISQKIFVRSKQ